MKKKARMCNSPTQPIDKTADAPHHRRTGYISDSSHQEAEVGPETQNHAFETAHLHGPSAEVDQEILPETDATKTTREFQETETTADHITIPTVSRGAEAEHIVNDEYEGAVTPPGDHAKAAQRTDQIGTTNDDALRDHPQGDLTWAAAEQSTAEADNNHALLKYKHKGKELTFRQLRKS